MRYIVIVLPSYDTGSIIGVTDDLDLVIWTDDIIVIDTSNGDLYMYEGKGWIKNGNLSEEHYDIEKLVKMTLEVL